MTTPSMIPLKNINPYRFVRFIRRTRKKADYIEVYFDTEKSPQLYFNDPKTFLNFLDERHKLQKDHLELLITLRSSVDNYNIIYVLDIKKWQLTLFEEPGEKRPTIKEELNDELHDHLKKMSKPHSTKASPYPFIKSNLKSSWLSL